MKKLYLIFCLVFSVLAGAQVINFPDANFKARLLQPNAAFADGGEEVTLDVNGNGEIEVAEAQVIYGLDVSNGNISDLTGIANFTNLKILNCNYNSLTTLSIPNPVSLIVLFAKYNSLTTVNVNFESVIEGLDLSHNNLAAFAVSNTYFADVFDLSYNHLTSLAIDDSDFSYFFIDHNNLSSVEFNGNVRFFWPVADFSNNQFSMLNFPANVFFDNSVHLQLGDNTVDNIYFNGTQPGNIDYSSAHNTRFDLGNFYMTRDCDPEEQGNVLIQNSPNLQEIVFKNGFNHTTLTCDEGGDIFDIPALYLAINNCPNLSHICVDAAEQANFQERIIELGLQNQVQINTNCNSLVLGPEIVISNNQFTISPIPAQNILQIQSNNNLVIRNVEIYNNLGQIVQKEIGSHESIDVSRLVKGSYYLKIYTDGSAFVKKFLKE
jgi:hypothetical protein